MTQDQSNHGTAIKWGGWEREGMEGKKLTEFQGEFPRTPCAGSCAGGWLLLEVEVAFQEGTGWSNEPLERDES